MDYLTLFLCCLDLRDGLAFKGERSKIDYGT